MLRIVQPTTARASVSPNSLAELYGSALFYAQRGWPVFPVVPARMNGEGGKVPRVKEWQQCASTSRDQIIAWWTKMQTSNVGVVCGPRSGLLVVDLDFKPARGIDGRAALAALEAVHGPVPLGPRVCRGSGSLHIGRDDEGWCFPGINLKGAVGPIAELRQAGKDDQRFPVEDVHSLRRTWESIANDDAISELDQHVLSNHSFGAHNVNAPYISQHIDHLAKCADKIDAGITRRIKDTTPTRKKQQRHLHAVA